LGTSAEQKRNRDMWAPGTISRQSLWKGRFKHLFLKRASIRKTYLTASGREGNLRERGNEGWKNRNLAC